METIFISGGLMVALLFFLSQSLAKGLGMDLTVRVFVGALLLALSVVEVFERWDISIRATYG